MIGCLSDWSTGSQLGCYRDSKQIRLTRPVKLIDLTAVPSTICLRHINIVHACMTQTLDWSKVDSLFSPIVMTDLDCHTVNLIDYIKVGQQNSKLPFHSCSHHGKKKKKKSCFISLQGNIWKRVLGIILFIPMQMFKPDISPFIYHLGFLTAYHRLPCLEHWSACWCL